MKKLNLIFFQDIQDEILEQLGIRRQQQLAIATEGAGHGSSSQIRTDGASRTTTSGTGRSSADGRGTTTAGRVISPLEGKDFNNLTSAEIALFERDYYIQLSYCCF